MILGCMQDCVYVCERVLRFPQLAFTKPGSPSPGEARLASKNVLSEFFSSPLNVPLITNT
jgi:hypothetical protein